jgi:glycosyltransferase involved in cell wall biosynthesis
MNYILSDGKPVITPTSIDTHISNLSDWMMNQKPLVCAPEDGLTLDLTSDKIIYCLQPTRIIARKRIEKDIQLFSALMNFPQFKDEFINSDRQLVLHITGPVPVEHEEDTRRVLLEYKKLVDSLPEKVADRIFLAFTVGTEYHPSFDSAGLTRLHIEDIYRLADIILFPSETEGRGLPIIESSACGIPIVCSRYYPVDVFEEVTGEHLPEELRIKYILFPEGEFPEDMLDIVSKILLKKNTPEIQELIEHNKKAVYERYGTGSLVRTFRSVFEYFYSVYSSAD